MALLNSHPDYMSFNGKNLVSEQYPVEYYEEFLHYIKSKYKGRFWHALGKFKNKFAASAIFSFAFNNL